MTVTIHQGDVFECLRGLPADAFDCVVTSPPYWGLRDYGVDGQIGLEKTLAEHLDVMVGVFAEIHRVLKPSGTVWLNYGDCYATTPNGRSAADCKAAGNDDRTFRDKPFSTIGPIYGEGYEHPFPRGKGARRGGGNNFDATLKPKDLCMIPNRLAIALQEWGWWVRSEIIWAKPNPMPESIKDRPATAHEKIFMLTKSSRYFYNYDAVRRPMAAASIERLFQDIEAQDGSARANGGVREDRPMKAVGRLVDSHKKQRGHGRRHAGFNDRWDKMPREEQQENGRRLCNYERAPIGVWEIGIKGFSEAHFATFPPDLVERCLLAGCPEGGSVLDPFGGAGTTALVADYMRRDCTLIELNTDYVEIARRRIERSAGLFAQIDILKAQQAEAPDDAA